MSDFTDTLRMLDLCITCGNPILGKGHVNGACLHCYDETRQAIWRKWEEQGCRKGIKADV